MQAQLDEIANVTSATKKIVTKLGIEFGCETEKPIFPIKTPEELEHMDAKISSDHDFKEKVVKRRL